MYRMLKILLFNMSSPEIFGMTLIDSFVVWRNMIYMICDKIWQTGYKFNLACDLKSCFKQNWNKKNQSFLLRRKAAQNTRQTMRQKSLSLKL